MPTPEPTATPQPTTEASGMTTGTDMTLSLGGGRVALRLFSMLPAGMTVGLWLVDLADYPSPPGALAGDLMFEIRAWDVDGSRLDSLPAEVNIAVSYDDVRDLNEANITLGQLNVGNNQWRTAPKLLIDPDGNFVAASITQLGILAVYAP